MSQLWSKLLDLLVRWQLVCMAALAAVLLFPTHLPAWLVAGALICLPLLWWAHRVRRGRFFTGTPADLPITLILLTLPVGLWVSIRPEITLPHLIKYLIAVGVFYALVNTFAAAGARELAGVPLPVIAGWGLLSVTTLIALASLLGMASSGQKLPFLPAGFLGTLPGRFTAFWNPAGFHPNIVGGALALLVPVAAATLLFARTWRGRLLAGLLLAFQVAVFLLTQSRGGLLGFAAALLVILLCRNSRWAWPLAALALVTLIAVAVVGPDPALDLLLGASRESIARSLESRMEINSRALYMLQDFAFTGVGPGMFPHVVWILYPLFITSPGGAIYVHNVYLQFGVDHGLPGLIAFLALLMVLAAMAFQAVRRSRGTPWQGLAVGLLGGFVAFLIHGLFDATGYTQRANLVVWTYFGLITALWHWTVDPEPKATGLEADQPLAQESTDD